MLIGLTRVPDQNVLGLDVAMDDALGVNRVQGTGYLTDQSKDSLVQELTLAMKQVAQIAPLDVTHGNEEVALLEPAA